LDWQPYSGSDLPDQGSAIKELSDLLASDNISLAVDFYPWQRSKKTAQQTGQYVGVYPAWTTDTFDVPLLSPTIDCSQIALFTQQDNSFIFETIEETFKNNIVGIVGTYLYPEAIQRLIDKYPHNISRAKDERSLIRMLAANVVMSPSVNLKLSITSAKKTKLTT